MKKTVLFASIAAASLAFAAAPAMASTLEVNLGAALAQQNQQGNVSQVAVSAAAAVGTTGSNVDISSTSVNAGQLASVTSGVAQGATSGTYNATASLAGTQQNLKGAINQMGLSVAGSGNLGSGSSISSTTANLGQSTSIDVKAK